MVLREPCGAEDQIWASKLLIPFIDLFLQLFSLFYFVFFLVWGAFFLLVRDLYTPSLTALRSDSLRNDSQCSGDTWYWGQNPDFLMQSLLSSVC